MHDQVMGPGQLDHFAWDWQISVGTKQMKLTDTRIAIFGQPVFNVFERRGIRKPGAGFAAASVGSQTGNDQVGRQPGQQLSAFVIATGYQRVFQAGFLHQFNNGFWRRHTEAANNAVRAAKWRATGGFMRFRRLVGKSVRRADISRRYRDKPHSNGKPVTYVLVSTRFSVFS